MKNQANHTNQKNQGSDNLKPFYNTTIPSDWKVVKLKDIGKIGSGTTPSTTISEYWSNGTIPWLPTGKVNDRIIKESQTFITEKAIQDKGIKLLPKGSIVIAMIGQGKTRGKTALLEISAWVNQNFAFIIPKQSIHSKYLFTILDFNYERIRYEGDRGGNQGSLNTAMIKNLKVLIPTLPEQHEIASLLSTWDEAINKNNQLIAQKELRKKWLMQNLLTGKKRLKGYNGEWKIFHLGEMFMERNETRYYDLPLLSVGANGIYPQSDSIKKDTSNEDKSKYKRICPGDIGYNTMRMWQGRSALSQLEGIVSPAYTIVKPKKNADSLFFSYLFKMPKLTNLFWRNSQGLVDDTLNCKFKDFAIIKVSLPNTKEEQTAIAAVLQTADKEIQLLKTKTEKLREQKKGMMQLLLTGKKRLSEGNPT